METKQFKKLVEGLTGTSLKDLTARDDEALSEILSDDDKTLDCAQFNELLLLVNKDRVSEAFFETFFGSRCRISSIESAIEHFQICAMLAYGNFVFAYRVMSRIKCKSDIDEILSDLHIGGTPPDGVLLDRPKKLLDINPIGRSDTPLIGYLSTGVIAEAERSKLLLTCLVKMDAEGTWDDYLSLLKQATNPNEYPAVLQAANRLKLRQKVDRPRNCESYLRRMASFLEARRVRLEEVQKIGVRNQDVYLT